MTSAINRRQFVKAAGAGIAAALTGAKPLVGGTPESVLSVDPTPRFDLSPYLFMQFMEPLGTTDGSVAAAWDFKTNRWRPDVIQATQELAPTMIRWGGCFSSYYRWKEAVGPRDQRTPMINLLWGGIETNQVGTAEFVNFCRQVKADPLMSVNFESDGRKGWMKDPFGSVRCGDAREAGEWVDYCNNPKNSLRLSHGHKDPLRIPFWQIGNETSYSRRGFDCETAATKTVEFAKSMRKADPSIKIVGWGDSGWARRMIEVAGEHLQYIAIHHMFRPDREQKDSPLQGTEYRKDPARTWAHLMKAYEAHEQKIKNACEQVKGLGIPLALTECHFALPGRNRCEVLSSWAAGVSYARFMNVHLRYGELLKIGTLADFCGTRWQVNAVMIPVPRGKAFLMPVAKVMKFYREHMGDSFLQIRHVPDDLDVAASRRDSTIILHVINTKRQRSITVDLGVEGHDIKSGKIYEMSTDPEFEVIAANPDPLVPKVKRLNDRNWTFPPASVSAVELVVA
jgi:alpha-L-arabinofuranosidase